MGQTMQSRHWSMLLLGGLTTLLVAGCEEIGVTTFDPMPPPARIERIGDNGGYPSPSADGRFVAFHSGAVGLVEGDTNNLSDIFVHDRLLGELSRVSVDSVGTEANGISSDPSISADGRFVAFVSAATNLVPGDTNGVKDIFVHDRQTGETTRVSVDSAGTQANWASYGRPSISADGRFVAFDSGASNLVPGDTNTTADIFVHDRETGETTRVSVDSVGTEANGPSHNPSISADGRFVAFESTASALVTGDTNFRSDIFVHDRETAETTHVSVDSSGAQGNNVSLNASLSADGRFVTFHSSATNLVTGDTNGILDVFVHDRETGETTRVSVDSNGNEAITSPGTPGWYISISADGRFVAFDFIANNLISGDTNDAMDVFVHDRVTGETIRLSVDEFGNQGDDTSYTPSISADGRTVAFESVATNLITGVIHNYSGAYVTPNPLSTAFQPLADDDGDGLTNHQELTETFTHYFKADSDGDGVNDNVEIGNGTDPLDPADF